MEKTLSLAEYLGVADSRPPDEPIIEISDPKEFAKAVLNSREFRSYVVNSLIIGSIPPAILTRVMDLAGWQKPQPSEDPAGKDGQPIETIRIVRVIVDQRPVIEAVEGTEKRVH